MTVFLLNGCFDSNQPDVYENVNGTVTLNGEPISGAKIYIRNNFDPGGYNLPFAEREEFTFEFNIPEQDTYIGVLFRHGADTAFTKFFDGELNAGVNSLTIPDEDLSNGVISYLIGNQDYRVSSGLFVVNRPDSILLRTIPFTETDSSGNFSLNSLYLAFGQTFQTGAGGRFTVTDSLQIIIANKQEILSKDQVKVQPNQSNYFEIDLD